MVHVVPLAVVPIEAFVVAVVGFLDASPRFFPEGFRLTLVQGVSEDLPDGQLNLAEVNAAVRQHPDPLLLVRGKAALLEQQVAQEVVAGVRRQHVQALLFQLRKGSLLRGQEARERLTRSPPTTEDRCIKRLLQPSFLEVGTRVLDHGDDLLVAIGRGDVIHRQVRQRSSQSTPKGNHVQNPLPDQARWKPRLGFYEPKLQVSGVLSVLTLRVLAVP